MARYKTKAIWYDLAKAFRAYIVDHEHVIVVQQTISGDDEQSAYIRVWEPCPDRARLLELTPEWEREEKEAEYSITRIRDTILFRDDEIVCSNIENDVRYIDLKHPKAYEQLLDWMKLCGLVHAAVILTGELAPWKEPEQCLKS